MSLAHTPATSSSFPYGMHFRHLLSGKTSLGELAGRLVMHLGLHHTAKALGLNPGQMQLLMSEAIMHALSQDAAILMSPQSTEAQCRTALLGWYDSAMEEFVSQHVAFAPVNLRQWYEQKLRRDIQSLQSSYLEFTAKVGVGIKTNGEMYAAVSEADIGAAGASAAAATNNQKTASDGNGPKRINRMGQHLKITDPAQIDNTHTPDQPFVIKCKCGAYGRRNIRHQGDRFYEIVSHYWRNPQNKSKDNRSAEHRLRELNVEEAEVLNKELGGTPFDERARQYEMRKRTEALHRAEMAAASSSPATAAQPTTT